MTTQRQSRGRPPFRGQSLGGSRSIVDMEEPSAFEVRWSDFIRFCADHEHSRWVFRGVGSITHDCRPSVGRTSNYRADHERSLLDAFVREAYAHLGGPLPSKWEWLALAQHHGVPTRLLDWTRNPLVACYFAVSSRPQDEDAAVYAIELARDQILLPGDASDPFAITDVKFLLPSALAPRISTQKGLFSAHPSPRDAWQPRGLADNTFQIAGGLRVAFQRRLFQLGIDSAHILPNLDGLGQSLAWQYTSGIGLAVVTL
jgi:hypothetical protein